jgi:regulatory protein
VGEGDPRRSPAGGTPDGYQRALRLLAQRPHFRRQLATKLRQRGYPADEVEEALDRLQAAGYLDDEAAARQFVEERMERRSWGPARVRAELLRRGVEPALVERLTADLLPVDDTALARAAAERWRPRGGARRAALARHLDRLGYSPHAIVTVLEELADGEAHLADGLD